MLLRRRRTSSISHSRISYGRILQWKGNLSRLLRREGDNSHLQGRSARMGSSKLMLRKRILDEPASLEQRRRMEEQRIKTIHIWQRRHGIIRLTRIPTGAGMLPLETSQCQARWCRGSSRRALTERQESSTTIPQTTDTLSLLMLRQGMPILQTLLRHLSYSAHSMLRSTTARRLR